MAVCQVDKAAGIWQLIKVEVNTECPILDGIIWKIYKYFKAWTTYHIQNGIEQYFQGYSSGLFVVFNRPGHGVQLIVFGQVQVVWNILITAVMLRVHPIYSRHIKRHHLWQKLLFKGRKSGYVHALNF